MRRFYFAFFLFIFPPLEWNAAQNLVHTLVLRHIHNLGGARWERQRIFCGSHTYFGWWWLCVCVRCDILVFIIIYGITAFNGSEKNSRRRKTAKESRIEKEKNPIIKTRVTRCMARVKEKAMRTHKTQCVWWLHSRSHNVYYFAYLSIQFMYHYTLSPTHSARHRRAHRTEIETVKTHKHTAHCIIQFRWRPMSADVQLDLVRDDYFIQLPYAIDSSNLNIQPNADESSPGRSIIIYVAKRLRIHVGRSGERSTVASVPMPKVINLISCHVHNNNNKKKTHPPGSLITLTRQ